jgi:glucose/arabinose dehydrogenase
MPINTPSILRRSAALAIVGLIAASCTNGSDETSSSQAPSASGPVAATDPVVATTAVDTTPTSTLADAPASDATTSPSTTTPPTTAPGPLPEPTIELHDVGEFEQPVNITSRPFDGRIFVIEQDGRVIAADDLSNATVLDITDLTSTDAERGLLGLAFHPELDFAYVNFTDSSGNTVVAEFEIDPDSAVFDEDSYREVLTVSQPFSNHNGGNITFGPDGMLYIGMGDGGSANDPNRSALDLSQQLGKILRIDPLPNGDDPYSVPADNPFVGVDGADAAIWSIGLRNPWRFSFDPVTGDLWIADVGQNAIEEINWVPAVDRLDAGRGENFGWSAFEGNDRFNDDQPTDGHTQPFYVYSHDEGRCSVSGGVRYRGEMIRDLAGWYVFGDFCTGEIWALDPNAPPNAPRVVDLGQLAGLSSIAQGPERELYAVSNAGTIARFSVPN